MSYAGVRSRSSRTTSTKSPLAVLSSCALASSPTAVPSSLASVHSASSGVADAPDIRARLARLSKRCRPASRLIFDQHVDHTLTTRVDAFPNGVLRWHAGASNIQRGWVSFDGIMFAVNTTVSKPVPVLPWINFGKPYNALSYVLHDDLCAISGLIRVNSWDVHNWGSVSA